MSSKILKFSMPDNVQQNIKILYACRTNFGAVGDGSDKGNLGKVGIIGKKFKLVILVPDNVQQKFSMPDNVQQNIKILYACQTNFGAVGDGSDKGNLGNLKLVKSVILVL